MYLHDLKLENLKLLRDFKLPFLHEGEPRQWTVLVGENGFCKTSVLRAIALAASGPERGNQLGQSFIPTMPDKRRESEEVRIEARFGFAVKGDCFHNPGQTDSRVYPGLDGPFRPAHSPCLVSNPVHIGSCWSAARQISI